MPNAKNAERRQTGILTVGTTGGGKTTMFSTIPGRKFLYIFDPNALNTIQGMDIDYEIFLPDHIPFAAVPLASKKQDKVVKRPEPLVYSAWEKDCEERLADGFFNDYDAIGVDSTTTFSDLVMDRIQWMNDNAGKWPNEADWTGSINTIKNAFRALTAVPNIIFYSTAHVEFVKDRKTGAVHWKLAMSQHLATRIPLLFSEIFMCRCEKDNEGYFYTVQTKPDRDFPFLRTTLRGLDTFEDVTVTDWDHPEGDGMGRLLEKATNYKPIKSERKTK